MARYSVEACIAMLSPNRSVFNDASKRRIAGESIATIELLKCPTCDSDFSLKQNFVTCRKGHLFAYTDNVIDFSAVERVNHIQQRSERSFGIEWTKYYATLGWAGNEFASEKGMFLTYTRSMPNFFAGKIVVDAGCGNGRYINVLNNISSPPPRLVIGIDLSDSIFVAAKNCATFKNVLFVKANLNLLPKILKNPVDYIYSIGVLHHTPSAKESFDNLARCVRPGGFISLYLYGKGNRLLYRVNSFLRNRFFQRWPHRLVYALCVLIAIPSQIFRIRFFGPWTLDFVNRVIFVSPDVHNMFDAYTAGYTSFHEKEEVEQWYEGNGFDYVIEAQSNRTALYCIGRRMHDRLP
jgi:SAM-dependent methyltransferase